MPMRNLASSVLIGLLLPAGALLAAEPERARPSGKAEARRGPDWEGDFYLRPHLGLSAWTDTRGRTTTASVLGGEAGYRYTQIRGPTPRWTGRTRAEVGYVLSMGDAQGMDLRLGSFLGPSWRFLLLQAGPDVFWNRWEFGGHVLDPTVGVGLPITATVPVGPLTLLAGMEPSWLANEARRVDWSTVDEFGFGHEFSSLLGIGLRVDSFGIFAGYTRRVVRDGVQQGISLGMNVR